MHQTAMSCEWLNLTLGRGQSFLKALYLKGYINGHPDNKMLLDTGAAVNIMPYLIKTNVALSDFNGQASEAQGILNVDLTVGSKTVPTSFFIINSKSTYTVLPGRIGFMPTAASLPRCTNV
jgi:hypothetical protein